MKMLNVLRLELWKQRKSFFAALFVLILGVGVTAFLLPMMSPLRVADSFAGAAALLVFLLPLVIAYLGASAASTLRKTEERTQEEVLPVHPFIRIYGAYITSLVLAACLSVLVLSLLGVSEVFYLVSLRLESFPFSVEMLVFYICSLHCMAFAITYLLNMPLLGAGLALILSTVDLFSRGVLQFAAQNLIYSDIDPGRMSTFVEAFSTISAAIVLLSIAIGIRRLERGLRLGFVRGSLLAFAILFGPLVTFVLAILRMNDVNALVRGYYGIPVL